MRALKRQLFLQHVAFAAAFLLIGEGGLWLFLRRAGNVELVTAIHKEIERVSAILELEPDRVEVEWTGEELRLDRRPFIWQVGLLSGEVIGGSREVSSGALRLPPIAGGSIPDEVALELVDLPEVGRLLVGRLGVQKVRLVKPNRPTTMPSSIVFDVRVAVATASAEAESARLATFLIVGYPALLGLAAFAAWRLVARAVRPVEEAFERERHFAGAASHELRTPLTAMQGELDVLLRRERSVAEYADGMRRLVLLVDRMSSVVAGLLTLARAQSGHLLLGARAVDVGTVVASVLELIRLLPGSERVTASKVIDESRKLTGDATLLSQAVRILVENALVHGGGGPVSLVARTGERWLEFVVEDRGPGHDGAEGVGLRTAKAILTAHRGSLSLEGSDHGGTKATALVPLV